MTYLRKVEVKRQHAVHACTIFVVIYCTVVVIAFALEVNWQGLNVRSTVF